jgi:hypothetical protein
MIWTRPQKKPYKTIKMEEMMEENIDHKQTIFNIRNIEYIYAHT